MDYLDCVRFVLGHTRTALSMALLFAAGALSAGPIMRYRIRFLLTPPEWFAKTLGRILDTRPSAPRLALFIFCFNGSAIFLYMLTGVIPWLPALVVFMAGLNVLAAGMLSQREAPAARAGDRPLPAPARICALLTFLLELPSLWYAMAMGWTMRTPIWDLLRGAELTPLRRRALAYLLVILPVLAISAAAEAYAVTQAQK